MFVLFFGSVAVWIVKKAAVALMDCPPMIINLKPSSSDAAKACCQRRNADAQPKFSKFLRCTCCGTLIRAELYLQ